MTSGARFDPTSGQLVACIVYDGASGAGKTTNVRKLAELLCDAGIGDQLAAELDGVTLSFDWLGLRVGARQGVPMRIDVVGAPGTPGSEARRHHLLARADAVVFVCDATPRGLRRASRATAPLCLASDERASTLPVIVQANKQDLPGAANPERAARELGLSPGAVYAATATDGLGVVDTSA